jgi:hypothetical protein
MTATKIAATNKVRADQIQAWDACYNELKLLLPPPSVV